MSEWGKNKNKLIAKGKYIAFVDSDDYIDKELFSKLEEYIDKNFLILCLEFHIVI